ncbi:DUF6020 family protein [Eggerthella timonensis]|uniref:DUF6020 family protein n=1 Tax=Eggerthella timonensis TaxID=1871008 RepID=UPI000C76ACD7|nr:DUF6020 family protein [Eggerthella timonensis]
MSTIRTLDKRMLIVSFVASALIAAALALGMHYQGLETYPLLADLPHRKVLFLALMAGVFVVSGIALYQAGTRGPKLLHAWSRRNSLPAISLTFCRKDVFVAAAIIVALWLPWIIVEYPASIDWDTYNQLYQFFMPSPTYYSTMDTVFDAEYIDHHPVFDTLVFGSFVWLGDVVGSQNAGMFLYSLAQCALTAAALALSCCYLEKLRAPKPLRLALLAFAALFPPIPNWAMCMCKDSLFSAVFVLYFIAFIEVARTKGSALKSKRFLIGYVALAGLCILTKKPGVYIVALSGLTILIAYRHFWKHALAAFVAPILLFSLAFPAIVYPLIGGVASGGKQEMLGTFFQQTTTYLLQHDDASADELEAIGKVMDIDAAKEKWKPEISDPAKNSFRSDASLSDMVCYFKAWAVQGARHPNSYFEATCRTSIQGLSPVAVIGWHTTCNPGKSALEMFSDASDKLTFHKPDMLNSASSKIERVYKKLLGSVPILNWVFTQGFYGGWLPLICIALALYRGKGHVLPFMPLLGSWVFLIMTPTVADRYVLPFVLAAPLLIGLACHALTEKRPRDAR